MRKKRLNFRLNCTDPVSRREVWNCIERAKKGRVILLTTHAMEEAEILGDKIAILSDGQLQCQFLSPLSGNSTGNPNFSPFLFSFLSLKVSDLLFVSSNVSELDIALLLV